MVAVDFLNDAQKLVFGKVPLHLVSQMMNPLNIRDFMGTSPGKRDNMIQFGINAKREGSAGVCAAMTAGFPEQPDRVGTVNGAEMVMRLTLEETRLAEYLAPEIWQTATIGADPLFDSALSSGCRCFTRGFQTGRALLAIAFWLMFPAPRAKTCLGPCLLKGTSPGFCLVAAFLTAISAFERKRRTIHAHSSRS